MRLIIVTDIFGRTSTLNELVSELSLHYEDILIVKPYADQKVSFLNEEAAYQYFQQHCGVEKLTAQLKAVVEKSNAPVDIVGFSVGATAAWVVSADVTSKNIRN